MAYVHEIKFFKQNQTLYAALFDNPPMFCNEFWIKNVKASELGVKKLPENVQFDKKYSVRELGIDPFPASKPLFDFIDGMAAKAWSEGTKLAIKQIGF